MQNTNFVIYRCLFPFKVNTISFEIAFIISLGMLFNQEKENALSCQVIIHVIIKTKLAAFL